MENNRNLSSKEILEMSEQEWQEYRIKSWERKREYYSQNVPDWYLKDQENFAQFLERRFKRR
ncbi:MAG: hypothetical protein LBJ97_00640 [Mycoplasmataceae bacterium]|nr:hypothetical protein [Mycoplasmataceae bacterium]